jgi:hypothetical protein
MEVAMAKKFFYVCAGLFLLAGAYALGARNAVAQAPSNPVVAVFDASHVITANGDIYSSSTGATCPGTWSICGNVFFGSGPTPNSGQTFGGIKARYR